MDQNHLKSGLGAVPEALGEGLGAILAPWAAQDRKREENLGSLAALGSPKGDQFGLTFGLKAEKNVKKGAPRKHLEKGPYPEGAQPYF